MRSRNMRKTRGWVRGHEQEHFLNKTKVNALTFGFVPRARGTIIPEEGVAVYS